MYFFVKFRKYYLEAGVSPSPASGERLRSEPIDDVLQPKGRRDRKRVRSRIGSDEASRLRCAVIAFEKRPVGMHPSGRNEGDVEREKLIGG